MTLRGPYGNVKGHLIRAYSPCSAELGDRGSRLWSCDHITAAMIIMAVTRLQGVLFRPLCSRGVSRSSAGALMHRITDESRRAAGAVASSRARLVLCNFTLRRTWTRRDATERICEINRSVPGGTDDFQKDAFQQNYAVRHQSGMHPL